MNAHQTILELDEEGLVILGVFIGNQPTFREVEIALKDYKFRRSVSRDFINRETIHFDTLGISINRYTNLDIVYSLIVNFQYPDWIPFNHENESLELFAGHIRIDKAVFCPPIRVAYAEKLQKKNFLKTTFFFTSQENGSAQGLIIGFSINEEKMLKSDAEMKAMNARIRELQRKRHFEDEK